jgi:hypothetical protein
VTLTLHLTDGRTMSIETSMTLDDFVVSWKAALEGPGVLVLERAPGARECIAAAQIVSVH